MPLILGLRIQILVKTIWILRLLYLKCDNWQDAGFCTRDAATTARCAILSSYTHSYNEAALIRVD